MELVINSPRDPDPSIASSSSMFPINGIKQTESDQHGPNFKELADSIRAVFSDQSLSTDFKASVLKGLSALMGRQITTSEAFAQLIENLETLNARDDSNREKAEKSAVFKPFIKKVNDPAERSRDKVTVGKAYDHRTKVTPRDEIQGEAFGSDEVITEETV